MTAPQASRRSPSTPLPLSFYGGGLVVLLTGPLCAMHLLTLSGFLPLVVALILLGVPISLGLRARGVNRVWVSRGATAAMVVGGLMLLILHPHSSLLFGRGSGFGGALLFSDGITPLLHFIAWVIAFRSFALLTDADVLMMIVPGLSMIILVAILETSLHVFLFLVPFSVSSLFLGMRYHEMRLYQQPAMVIGQPLQEWRHRWRFLGTLCLVIAVLSTSLAKLLADLSLPKEIVDRFGVELATYLSQMLITTTHQPYIAVARYLNVGEEQFPQGSAVLFRVATSYSMRWRGNVFDTYDGRCWQVQAAHSLHLLRQGPAGVLQVPRDPYEDYERSPRRVVDHEFSLVVYCQGIMIAAYEPVAVAMGNFNLRVDSLRRLTCSRLEPGMHYRVRTSVKQVSAADLRRATGPIPPALQSTYLSLPPDLPPRVRDYAWQVCRGADNPYDRLYRLETHLATVHTYNPVVPSIPADREAVDYFLFDMKEGSCLHFATALAVLGRVVGVPTRLVTGFNPGTQAPDSGDFQVRERDAHAWVEAYLAPYGWIEFDPTRLTSESVSPWAEMISSFRQKVRQSFVNAGLRLSQGLKRLRERGGIALLGGAGASLVLWGLIRIWKLRSRFGNGSVPPSRRAVDPARQQAFRHFEALCRLLRRYGRPRYDHETPFEYAAAIAAGIPAIAPQLEEIVQTYVAGRYGDEPLSSEQVQASAQAWNALSAHLRTARRTTPREAWKQVEKQGE